MDLALFNSYLVQVLLRLTIQLESSFISSNLFASCLSFLILLFIYLGYFYGLVFMASPNSSISILDVINGFIVVWSSLYLRLRSTSLNYFNLEIDTSSVSWDNLLTRFQEKQGFLLTNKVSSQAPISLLSIKHSSYLVFKTAVISTYQKRGMRSAAKAVVEADRKVVSQNSNAFAGIVGAGITVGGAVYTVNEGVKIQEKTIETQENATAESKRQFDIKNQIPETKEVSFSQKSLIARLDGSPVEDISSSNTNNKKFKVKKITKRIKIM